MSSSSLNEAESAPQCTISGERVRSVGWVYLVTDGTSYKVGHARDPEKRLNLLQTGHPEVLRIVAVFEGSRKAEHEIHELFAGSRFRGEWFILDKEILAFFEAHGFVCICRRTPDPECFIHGEGRPAW